MTAVAASGGSRRTRLRYVTERRGVLATLLISPAVIFITALVGIPLGLAIYLSFTDATGGSLTGKWIGIANFRTFLEQTAAYRRALREAEYGSLATDGALLDRISPIHKVDKIAAPLMVIHGTRDPRVPIGEAKQMAAALEKRGTPVVLLTFEDEGHGLAKLKNRLVAYPAMVKFLDELTRGGERLR